MTLRISLLQWQQPQEETGSAMLSANSFDANPTSGV